jgi:hypothetical protein
METIKTIWNYLDGKKSVIAALAGLALAWAQAKGYVSPYDGELLAGGLTVITGVAVGHKITKAL